MLPERGTLTKVLILATLACYLAAAVPVRYAADDFTDAAGVRDVLGSVHDFYTGWSGRYTYGLTKTVSKLGGEALAALPALLVIVALWRLADDKILLVAIFTCAPALIQSVYWNAGATGYGLAVVGAAACVKVKIGALATLLLAFVTAGLSETMVVVLPILCVGWFVMARDRRALVALVGSLAGLVVTVLSPGVAIRETYFLRADLVTTTLYAVRSMGVYAATALRNAPLSVAAVGLVPLLGGGTIRRDTGKILVLALVALAVCFATSFVSFYATGGPLPTRAAIIPLAVCLGALYYGVMYSGYRLNRLRIAQALLVAVFLSGCVQAAQIGAAWLNATGVERPDISLVFP